MFVLHSHKKYSQVSNVAL